MHGTTAVKSTMTHSNIHFRKVRVERWEGMTLPPLILIIGMKSIKLLSLGWPSCILFPKKIKQSKNFWRIFSSKASQAHHTALVELMQRIRQIWIILKQSLMWIMMCKFIKQTEPEILLLYTAHLPTNLFFYLLPLSPSTSSLLIH